MPGLRLWGDCSRLPAVPPRSEVSVTRGRAKIPVPARAIAEFCRRHHVRRLALFGSVLRDDFGPDSDVDVLVEFQPGHVPGFAFFEMEQELSRILGRRVDLNTPQFLDRAFRDQVLSEAETHYVAA
ncbi:MAG: hypothetical protein BroJett029_29940 [Alphaproteobacteria bacterium]|nr:MAG: hypothetical protein BroJett029_29940 [Alphaproteobacteria bacterium]